MVFWCGFVMAYYVGCVRVDSVCDLGASSGEVGLGLDGGVLCGATVDLWRGGLMRCNACRLAGK